ncbi:MAG: helix-turn-helix domain-containing protein [Clostridia bacterium]|nr:helix-turn-helix domain-containing protein [Clostridia bacterium]
MGLFSKKHSIGKTIAELRKEKGWTQIELAEKLQVSDKAVSKWEKDSGAPSVEFFPALAELFGVSIDYIMTGKKVEPEIITMSKIELCAKKDDPALLINFGANSKDENGKSLMDYIKQYNSLKVLKALFDKCSHQTHYMGLFNHGNFIDLNKCADEILLLMLINCERKYIKEVCRSNVSIYAVSDIDKNGYLKIIEYLIKNYDKLPQDQKEYYFGTETILKPKKAWLFAYPYFLDIAYKINKKVFNELLAIVVATNNDYNAENERLRERAGSYYNEHFSQWKEYHCYIDILQSTVVQAFNNGEEELATQLNSFCKNKLTTYQVNVLAIENNSKLSDKEKQLAKSIHDGIVCIDEILSINDFKLIKKTLNEYPIHIIEKLYSMFNQKEWKQLFEYAVDTNDTSLATAIAKRNIEEIEKSLLSYWSGTKADNLNINKKHLYINENGRRKDILPSSYGMYNINRAKTLNEVIEKLNAVKQRIIDDLSLKLDKEKTVGDLTKEYFEKELSKGNIDMVIIKLCVRLEAILRSDYHYEGDFSEMLNKYCAGFNTYDDEDNNYDPYTPRKLNKLRIQRNGIVHSEKCKETLTLEELKWCIDYICKMG